MTPWLAVQGFPALLADRGQELLEKALLVLKACPEACDASCYRCLRSYKNKFDHSLLDRHVGAELLEYLVTSRRPSFNAERLHRSTVLLYHDLLRQGLADVEFALGTKLDGESAGLIAPILATTSTGNRSIIALSGPADIRVSGRSDDRGIPRQRWVYSCDSRKRTGSAWAIFPRLLLW